MPGWQLLSMAAAWLALQPKTSEARDKAGDHASIGFISSFPFSGLQG